MVFRVHDPVADAATPPNETRAEKAARKERQVRAQKISDQIDDELLSESVVLKGKEQMVKVLLFGQSESGKSTTIKNFRMRFATKEWAQERASWRAVLQLNLVQSVNVFLSALRDKEDDLPLSDDHNLLRLHLRSLIGVENNLKQLLGIEAEDVRHSSSDSSQISPRALTKFRVRSHNWKRFLEASHIDDTENCCKTIKHNGVNTHDVTEVIAGCKDDIIALWKDPAIHEILQRGGVHLENSATFYLNNAHRLAGHDYEPTDDDILHARLRVLDIQEYELDVSEDSKPQVWKIYNIGCLGTQRHAWLPYLDQVNAIIFLAPVSGFDEYLRDGSTMNRLEDSFILWKTIYSSRLLNKATLVVFLNKIDILARKLADGVVVKRFLPSYGNRPNNTLSVVKYLRQKFMDSLRHNSPVDRLCHIYFASAIDARTVEKAKISVQDGIMRAHLKNQRLL